MLNELKGLIQEADPWRESGSLTGDPGRVSRELSQRAMPKRQRSRDAGDEIRRTIKVGQKFEYNPKKLPTHHKLGYSVLNGKDLNKFFLVPEGQYEYVGEGKVGFTEFAKMKNEFNVEFWVMQVPFWTFLKVYKPKIK